MIPEDFNNPARVRCMILNAARMVRHTCRRKSAAWVIARDLFGYGQTTSRALCEAAQILPDDTVKQIFRRK